MPTLYAPGRTPVAVTPRGFAVLEAGASAALLVRVRAVLAEGRGLGGVIEALTGAYGASLTAIPAFAVALSEGESVRVAVRGEFAFEVDAASSERVSGAGVTTWTERVIPAVQRVTLTTSAPDASAPAELEIADGIVLAASVQWDAAAARSSSSPGIVPPASAPAPIVEAGWSAAEPGPSDVQPGPSAAQSAPTPQEPAAPSPVEDEPAPPAAPASEPEAPAWPLRDAGPLRAANPEAPVTTVSGLIDSSSVPSVPSLPSVASAVDAETLLPLDSALHPIEVDSRAGSSEDASAPDTGFDAEWGSTVIRSVDGVVPQAAVPAEQLGDHDGATISLAQARALRAAAPGGADAQDAASVLPTESIPAPLAPPRPPAPGRLRLSTGQVVPLDRTVVIGRRPRSTRVSGTDLPHLVAVDSPQQDISRSHVELRVEGESILATDLRTTNGTTLLRPGTDPVRLHPGEGTVVVPGDVLDLGDGITVAIEGNS